MPGGTVEEVALDGVPWLDDAFESAANTDANAGKGQPVERVAVKVDGGDFDQAELGEWLEWTFDCGFKKRTSRVLKWWLEERATHLDILLRVNAEES